MSVTLTSSARLTPATPGSEWVVVGVSGVTCGGKTTLARRLARMYARVTLFHQDHYFHADDSPHHVKCADLDHNDYDRLSALDMARMHRDVCAALRGDCPPCPPSAGADEGAAPPRAADEPQWEVPGKSIMVIEGFTVLNYKPIAELCDLKFLLTLEYGECRARRALRVYSPPDVGGYFERCVWPAYCRHRDELAADPSVRELSGAEEPRAAVHAELRRLGARPVAPAPRTPGP